MAMPVKDFRQLEKLMGLTTSDNDAEALSALRMANTILKRHGYTWSSAFKRLVKVENPLEGYMEAPSASVERPAAPYREESLHESRKRRIKEVFEELDGVELGRHEGFVASLKEWFEEKGWLTDAQRESLFSINDRIRG
jgi:hypothetical protein